MNIFKFIFSHNCITTMSLYTVYFNRVPNSVVTYAEAGDTCFEIRFIYIIIIYMRPV